MNFNRSIGLRPLLAAAALSVVAGMACSALSAEPIMNTLPLGLHDSEQAHALVGKESDAGTGQFDEAMRRLLPLQTPSWESGQVRFHMKVDPGRSYFFSARFSGERKMKIG